MSTRFVCVVLALGACSVPDKKVVDSDAGTDGGGQMDAPSDAPETMITSGPPEFSNSGAVTIAFSSNLAGATFECSVDSEVPAACTSPFTRSLSDGAHTFSVRASDTSGNSDATPAEHLWTIDTAAPQTTLIETPPPADNSVMVRFSFGGSESNIAFDCSLDNAAYQPCVSGSMFGPVGDGAHSFAVRAHDRAGNLDASPAIFAWTVDTSTPDTQLLTGPDGPQAATMASFTFLSPDAGGSATFECQLDGGAFAACTSPHNLSNLPETAHVFAVRVRDAAGNYDPTPSMRTWTVDLTPPDTMIMTGPTGLVAQASASFGFASNELDVSYSCSVDGSPYVACTSPDSMMSLAQGAHSFAVRATDAAGHTDATPATRAWTVDTVPPAITLTSGPMQNGTSGPRVVVGFTVSEGVTTCSLDTAPFAPCTTQFADNLPAGAHSVRVRSTDAAGNVATITRNFNVACVPADPAGASGVLHLDDSGQLLTNAVTGGAGATLGDTTMVEPGDPASIAGRFNSALVFAASESDHVTWPMALGASADVTIELWSRPDAVAGARDVAVSADGKVALRVTAEGSSAVRYSISIGNKTVSSAAVPAGTWHHVLASLDSPTVRLWVNGVRTEIGGANDTFSLGELHLGGAGAAAYSGVLDEVWVGQAAITSDEPALSRYCPQ